MEEGATRVLVDASPDPLKEGSHFDLLIALGLLVTMGVLPGDEIAAYGVLGELALDGALLPVAGGGVGLVLLPPLTVN